MKNTKVVNYKGTDYRLEFNLNVMEEIQEEYGSVEKWGDLTDGASGEPNFKAVLFGLRAMIAEGVEMDNEDNEGVEGYVAKKPLNTKQVGRMLTEIGFEELVGKLNDTVIESTKSDEKN